MRLRTVGEVAGLTGVTVRTLHHYDEIGLLEPSERTAAGYRLYSDGDLIRLHDRLYYADAAPEISDFEYDQLFAELRRIEEEHPELLGIGIDEDTAIALSISFSYSSIFWAY